MNEDVTKFTLAIVGRPNVGKSTLYNRLAGKRLSIVDDTPGVTRDWRRAEAHLFGRHFHVIDTAGLEESFDASIPARMRRQTEAALAHADVILFVVDGRVGITGMDKHFADWLRRQGKPVILGVNKCENEKAVSGAMAEAYSLGLGEPLPLSAEHNLGMEDLYHILSPYFPEEEIIVAEESSEENEDIDFDAIEGLEDFEFVQEEDAPEKPIKVAIIGRPNVGKSTLLNAIMGEERSMTGPEAGITRDAVAVDWEFGGRAFKLVDTAGMRKKARVQEKIEKLSVEDTLRAVRLAQVVILVLDAGAIFDKQDLQIAAHVLEEGRALVVALNKWDLVKDKDKALEDLSYKFDTALAQVKEIPFVTMSALKNKGTEAVLKKVLETYGVWNQRVSTSKLNRWLAGVESQNPAPLVDGRPNRLKYITQIKTRPPTFVLWVSRSEELPGSYRRYVIGSLRRDFDIPGVPIRLLIRRSKNPFA